MQHLHKGALAGAVLAHDRVHLAGQDLKVDAAACPDAPEALARADQATGDGR